MGVQKQYQDENEPFGQPIEMKMYRDYGLASSGGSL